MIEAIGYMLIGVFFALLTENGRPVEPLLIIFLPALLNQL